MASVARTVTHITEYARDGLGPLDGGCLHSGCEAYGGTKRRGYPVGKMFSGNLMCKTVSMGRRWDSVWWLGGIGVGGVGPAA